MSGASQVVYCTIMAQQGFTAANHNFSGPDEASARLNIITRTLERPPRRVLCNSAGFGGTNSCLVLGFGG
jgi:3-oxoacyl-[acyl-carrier-protein] synthase-1